MKSIFRIILVVLTILIVQVKAQSYLSQSQIDSLINVYYLENKLSNCAEDKSVLVMVFDCKSSDTLLFSISMFSNSINYNYVNPNYFFKFKEKYVLVRNSSCNLMKIINHDIIIKINNEVLTHIQNDVLRTQGFTQGTVPIIIYSYIGNRIVKEWSGVDDFLPPKFYYLYRFDMEYMQGLEEK